MVRMASIVVRAVLLLLSDRSAHAVQQSRAVAPLTHGVERTPAPTLLGSGGDAWTKQKAPICPVTADSGRRLDARGLRQLRQEILNSSPVSRRTMLRRVALASNVASRPPSFP
jgi:hypothetical protein